MSTDARTAALAIGGLLRAPEFEEAVLFIANEQAYFHEKEMRRYVSEGQYERAAVSEACATEWESILVRFKNFVKKHQPQNGE